MAASGPVGTAIGCGTGGGPNFGTLARNGFVPFGDADGEADSVGSGADDGTGPPPPSPWPSDQCATGGLEQAATATVRAVIAVRTTQARGRRTDTPYVL